MYIHNIIKNINWNYIIITIIIVLTLLLFWILYKNYFKNADIIILKNETFNTQENINSNIKKEKLKAEIVLYYATWCGFSRMFLPEWEKFEQYAKINMPDIKVTKILCENENESVCQQKGIHGYPTIILYTGNKQKHYNGERKIDQIIKFIKENIK